MMNKSISVAIYLFVLSFLFILGLISYWHFETWRIIDWIVIIGNVITGIILLTKSDKNGKSNR